MPDDSTPKGFSIKRKVGPLPLWGYAVVIGGVAFAIHYVRSRGAAATSGATITPIGTVDTSGGSTVSGGSGGGSGSGTTATTPAPTTTPTTTPAPVQPNPTTGAGMSATARACLNARGTWEGDLMNAAGFCTISAAPGGRKNVTSAADVAALVASLKPGGSLGHPIIVDNGNSPQTAPPASYPQPGQTPPSGAHGGAPAATRGSFGDFIRNLTNGWTALVSPGYKAGGLSGYTSWEPPTAPGGNWTEYAPGDYVPAGQQVGVLPNGMAYDQGRTPWAAGHYPSDVSYGDVRAAKITAATS